MEFPTWIQNETVLVTCVHMNADAELSSYLLQGSTPDASPVVVSFAYGRVLLNGIDVELTDDQVSELYALAEATSDPSFNGGVRTIGRQVSVDPHPYHDAFSNGDYTGGVR